MKAMTILLAVALVASAALNMFLWKQNAQQRAELEAVRASAAEVESVRAENETLKKQSAAQSPAGEAESRELARLRNEIGQLRKQAADADKLRAQAAEAAQLRTQLATTTQRLAQKEKDAAEASKLTPEQTEQMQQARQRAQSISCANNLKQIGLAARLWANDHGNVFPPDLATMRNELNTPRILFCPAAPGGVQATDWAQLNPTTISYQFLNPNGNEAEPQKPLTACPIHGHVGLSDGSVQMKQ
jgi:hypothetical protein